MTKWIACLGLVAFVGGCDPSKEELESTKSQLASVNKERDELKKQVTSLQKDLETTKSALATAKLPEAATSPGKAEAKDAKDVKHAAAPAPAKKTKDAKN